MAIGVGAFGLANRAALRAPTNPLDKSTVVSIYPKAIQEIKHTIQPGVFNIPAGKYDSPAILVIGPSSWWRELDENQPLLEIPTSSIQIADSIIKDYCNGLLACNMGDVMPGLFYVPGEKNVTQIMKDFKYLLDRAKVQQDSWYKELVKMADVLWARTNGNPLTISDDMRLAAQELQLKDKPWLKDFNTLELRNCPACGVLRNNDFPVCANCRTIIDVKRFNELGFRAQAQA